jgi:hypothetical protein
MVLSWLKRGTAGYTTCLHLVGDDNDHDCVLQQEFSMVVCFDPRRTAAASTEMKDSSIMSDDICE